MIALRGRAKINLFLDVRERRGDGYHEIVTVTQSISVHDNLTLEPAAEIDIEIPGLPGSANTVAAAAELLERRVPGGAGAKIFVEKNIPVAAGLGGGSADAAATLVGINRLWNLDIDLEELTRIGASVGADVPLCLVGGTLLATGVGERIESISSRFNPLIVLGCPDLKINTGEAYRRLDREPPSRPLSPEPLIEAVVGGDLGQVGHRLHNSFEPLLAREYPVIGALKTEAASAGAAAAMMSGSGPAVFAFADSEEVAVRVARAWRALVPWVAVAAAAPTGVAEDEPVREERRAHEG